MEKIKLDGREFTAIQQDLTAAQDDYLLAHLRLAGAIDVISDLVPKKKQQRATETKAEKLLTQILLSGRKHFILAGCLTEAGKKWEREEADRNAGIFAEITDESEKRMVQTYLVQFVLGFFSRGESSPATSPKSSSPSEKDHHTESAEAATSASSR